MTKEDIIQAVQELSSNVTKMSEYSKIRIEQTDKAVEKWNAVMGTYKKFKEKWEELDLTLFNGILQACSLADKQGLGELYANLMEEVEEDPQSSQVKNCYNVLRRVTARSLEESHVKWDKSLHDREDLLYTLLKKSLYFKSEYDYKSLKGD